ncbi:hypothetical protein MNBD_GAMMA01-488, partial [hydrothermal vent metagenome]
MDSLGGAFITLMYNGDGKLSGAKDVNGTQVLWIEYDLVTGKLSKARDYGNREINYSWEVINATASPKRYKLTNVKDARGYDWQYAYSNAVARDGRVDVISRTDPEGRIKTIAYSSSGRASGITNALGHTTTYRFDYIKSRKEFYLKTSYPGGRVTETWYERDGEVKRRDINGINIITITEDLRKDIEKDTFGRTTTKAFDEFKNLLKTTYPDGTSTSTTYDLSTSNPLTNTDERGTITKYEYWPNGRLKKMTEALGTSVERSTEYTYDQYGQMLTKTQVGDAVTATAITQYFFDNKGNVNKIIDAELNERQYTSYDSQGNNLVMIDGRGNTWTQSYDALGNQTNSKNPLNEETINTYDKVNNHTKIIYPDTNFIQFEYDNRNRMIKQTDELGYSNTTTYDQAGNRVRETDKAGRATQYRYDLLNRQDEIEDAAGNIIKYTYPNPNGSNLNPGSIYQPINIQYPTYTQGFKYDLKNRVFEEILNYQTSTNIAKVETQKIKYDATNNRIESIDAENRSTKAEYDPLNRLTKSIDSLLQQTVYTYDDRNNMLSLTDALNQAHIFTYDKNNQKLTESRPLGQTETYTYNANNQMATRTDAKGQKTEVIYNQASRNTQVNYHKTDTTLDKTVTFSYNTRGNLTSYDDGTTQGVYTYDNAQQKLTETITYGTEIFNSTYSYHPDGQKASYTNLENITYSYYYNNLGILQNIVIPNEGNISYQNFNWNRPQTINYPGGITRTLAYDGLQRINSINVQDTSNQTLMNYDYTYTPTGNITNKNTEHGDYSYGYDDLDRLTNADYPNLTDETFTYDALGNRKTDSSTGITQWLYNQNNQLLNSVNNQFTYDANGSQIEEKDNNAVLEKQYIYNTENRLAEIKDGSGVNIATYYYDPFGRRLSKTVTNPDATTTTTYFHYNDEGYSAEKTNGQITSYLFSPQNTWSTSPILKRENNTYYYYQNDHLGTPNILHDKQGQVVNAREMKAFGEWSNSTDIINSNFAFAGQYRDAETSTYYNFHRNYHPGLGRYIKSDPIGLGGGLNMFNYVNNNPNIIIDYLGLKGLECGWVKSGCEEGYRVWHPYNREWGCSRPKLVEVPCPNPKYGTDCLRDCHYLSLIECAPAGSGLGAGAGYACNVTPAGKVVCFVVGGIVNNTY